MTFDDLENIPFKPFGRGLDGCDCYGYVILCFQIIGKTLKDTVYEWDKKKVGDEVEKLPEINVKKINSPKKFSIIQSNYNGELHIGFLIDGQTVKHMTHNGVRTTPLFVFENPTFYEVI